MRTQSPLLDSTEWEPVSPEDACLKFGDFLGPALQVMRYKRRLSQDDVAKALTKELLKEKTQSYVSRVESGPLRGGIGISWERLALFCKLLRCHPKQVVGVAEFLAVQANRDIEEVRAELKEATDARLAQEDCRM